MFGESWAVVGGRRDGEREGWALAGPLRVAKTGALSSKATEREVFSLASPNLIWALSPRAVGKEIWEENPFTT